MLYFVCSTNNDLFSAVKKSGAELEIASSLAAAVAAAEKGDGILVLADDYPRQMVAVDEKVIETARTKGVRLYLEYFSCEPHHPNCRYGWSIHWLTYGFPKHYAPNRRMAW